MGTLARSVFHRVAKYTGCSETIVVLFGGQICTDRISDHFHFERPQKTGETESKVHGLQPPIQTRFLMNELEIG